MNQNILTIEEENLSVIFDTSSRTALKRELNNAMADFGEPELCEIAANILAKLDAMTDEEFSAIIFTTEYYDEGLV